MPLQLLCPKRCSECSGEHHFGDAYCEFADEKPDHPAAQEGHIVWYECKHCPAWITEEQFEAIARGEALTGGVR